jgi:hypothetical protein
LTGNVSLKISTDPLSMKNMELSPNVPSIEINSSGGQWNSYIKGTVSSITLLLKLLEKIGESTKTSLLAFTNNFLFKSSDNCLIITYAFESFSFKISLLIFLDK